MNKNLIVLLCEIFIGFGIYFALNTYMPMDFTYTCPFDGKEYQTTIAILITTVYLASVVFSTILHMLTDVAEQNKLKAYKKEHEKNSISGAEKDSVIAALENKVKTLETALDSLIKKENK